MGSASASPVEEAGRCAPSVIRQAGGALTNVVYDAGLAAYAAGGDLNPDGTGSWSNIRVARRTNHERRQGFRPARFFARMSIRVRIE